MLHDKGESPSRIALIEARTKSVLALGLAGFSALIIIVAIVHAMLTKDFALWDHVSTSSFFVIGAVAGHYFFTRNDRSR